tara:strand:+ start:79 stop:969 length:891 start_codon:yes stop_codon:yes gene_type:complete
MKYFLAVDIGGTTFNSGLFNDSFEQIDITQKDKIRYHNGKEEVVSAIIGQIFNLLKKNNIQTKDVLGLGVASPGPLDIDKGKILDTINLIIFQNYHLTEDFSKRLNIDTYIQNDANLFALGEWYHKYKNENVSVGITIGTGFGLGLIINGKIYQGAHGMGMEYSVSPFKWGICEENISIRYIRKRAKEEYGEEISPRFIEQYYYKKDPKAIKIYQEFGENLGQALSHVINMLDPAVISIGGGLSNAFDCFQDSMFKTIEKYSPTFIHHRIKIEPSNLKEKSTMLGACVYVKNKKNI